MVTSRTHQPFSEVQRTGFIPDSLSKLRAMILLAGRLRPCPMAQSVGRSTLDLPVDDQRTVVSYWAESIQELKYSLGRRELPVRLLLDRDSRSPESLDANEHTSWTVERDSNDYRGTAGVLMDACSQYDKDDYILVANAHQLLLEPLVEVVTEMARNPSDVCLVGHKEGTPGGLFLIRCGALAEVAPIGYVDLKEMALPDIAKAHQVKVIHRDQPTALPIKSVEEYLKGLRRFHQNSNGVQNSATRISDPFQEDWQSAFNIIEDGATVDPRAVLFDSVVLKGVKVEAEAIVVRSLLSNSATISTKQTVIDKTIS